MAMVNPTQVQKYLSGVNYPVSKDQLIEHVKRQGADSNVVETIQSMARDRFNSPKEVSEEIGKQERGSMGSRFGFGKGEKK